jgi:hypothetical protein
MHRDELNRPITYLGRDTGRVLCQEFLGFGGGDGFVEIIVYHTNWGTAAGSETLGELDGKFPARRHADGVVMRIACRAVDAGEFAKPVHQLVAATHGTG